MKKICSLATLPITVKYFMLGNLNYLAENGYDCYCICNNNTELTPELLGKVKYIPMEIKWGYVSLKDFVLCTYRMYKIFKKEKFDIIQYATFNAGLSACVAGWLARVPVRINLQWGVSYPIYTGKQRIFRRAVHKLMCMLATNVQPDSFANLKFCVEDGLYSADKACVIYNGSACGADLQKFDISKKQDWKTEVLEELGIGEYNRIFGYVGRIVKEKGISELIAAFREMNDFSSYLVLVGPMDENPRIDDELMKWAKEQKNVFFTGPKSNPAKYFASFDYICLLAVVVYNRPVVVIPLHIHHLGAVAQLHQNPAAGGRLAADIDAVSLNPVGLCGRLCLRLCLRFRGQRGRGLHRRRGHGRRRGGLICFPVLARHENTDNHNQKYNKQHRNQQSQYVCCRRYTPALLPGTALAGRAAAGIPGRYPLAVSAGSASAPARTLPGSRTA